MAPVRFSNRPARDRPSCDAVRRVRRSRSGTCGRSSARASAAASSADWLKRRWNRRVRCSGTGATSVSGRLSGAALPGGLGDQRIPLRHDPPGRQPVGHKLRRLAKPQPKRRIAGDPRHGRCQRRDIAIRHQQPVLAIPDQLGNAVTAVETDGRQAGTGGLGQHIAETFIARGDHQHIARPHPVRGRTGEAG